LQCTLLAATGIRKSTAIVEYYLAEPIVIRVEASSLRHSRRRAIFRFFLFRFYDTTAMNFVWKIGRVTLKRTINYTEIAVFENTRFCGIKN